MLHDFSFHLKNNSCTRAMCCFLFLTGSNNNNKSNTVLLLLFLQLLLNYIKLILLISTKQAENYKIMKASAHSK